MVLRWFVAQHGHEEAATWLRRFARAPDLLVAPDLLRFEVYGSLARLQRGRPSGWAQRTFTQFDALGLRTLPTTMALFERGVALSRQLGLAGYDALYVAHAEALGLPWLTADEKALRALEGDSRVCPLVPPTRA